MGSDFWEKNNPGKEKITRKNLVFISRKNPKG
jgi:hypothetical protein